MSSFDVQVGGNHYKNFKIQPTEFIEKNDLSFLEGCIIKRVCRHRAKNGAEDIDKAIHELQMLKEIHYPDAASFQRAEVLIKTPLAIRCEKCGQFGFHCQCIVEGTSDAK